MEDEPNVKDKDIFEQMFDATKDALDGAADAYRETFDQLVESLPTFDEVISQAIRLPGTSVDRRDYLTKVIGKRYGGSVAQAAIETTPARAGLTQRQIANIAKNSIGKDGRRTTALSFAAGIPGGVAGAATIPADMVQFYGYLIRTIQKLTFLYGWRDLIHIDAGQADRATSRALLVFLGVMAGTERANKVFRQLATRRVAGASDQNTRAMLLTGGFDTDLEEISVDLGKRMARRLTGQVAGKTVPIVGGIVSGALTSTGYADMAKRLHNELKRYA